MKTKLSTLEEIKKMSPEDVELLIKQLTEQIDSDQTAAQKMGPGEVKDTLWATIMNHQHCVRCCRAVIRNYEKEIS